MVELTRSDRDLHRFVWQSKPAETLIDYQMTRVTFGMSASSFAANMSVKQNAINHATEYPQAAKVVVTFFYVEDCLTGANSANSNCTICLPRENSFLGNGIPMTQLC